MNMKQTASLLLCAVTLLAVAPSKAFAQTVSQPAVAVREQKSGGVQAKPRHELKAVFAEELAKHKADTVSAAESKRLAKGWLNPQTTPKHSSGFSKKDAFLVVLLIVVITGLAIVLVHNGVEGGSPTCSEDPSNPTCIP
jgi:hypothetical protein